MIAIANDHAGFHLKQAITKYLNDKSIAFKDFGIFDNTSVDYPDCAERVAREVVSGKFKFGILICGTGIGMSISANKISGVRAAVLSDTFSAKASRAHNNANILCLGERVLGAGLAVEILEAFLNTEFEGGRHAVRVEKITALEKKGK